MTGTDPNYISAMEHFESMRHADIYTATQQIDAVEILRASGAWLSAAAGLRTSFPLTRDSADRVMNATGWEGEAADAAYASTRSFADSVNELADVLAQVGARLGAVAAAAEAVKLAVVPPGSSGPVGTIARLLEAANVIDAQMAQEALRQEAVLTMNMVYKPAYTAAGTGVPALPAPPPVPEAPAPLESPRPHPAVSPRLRSSDAGGPNGSTDPSVSGTGPVPDTPSTPPSTEPDTTSPRAETTPPPRASENEPRPDTGEAPSDPPFQEPGPSEAPSRPDADGEPPTAPPAQPPLSETPPVPQPAPPAPPAAPPVPPPPAPPDLPPIADPSGQPGVTGPVPGEEESRPPDQPGVIP
ncbi:hypothetical protein [Nocardia brevicatena]|uniref:hypothetical protein n=1 Tax=Nocardia brevicatena TaxID=37327 RepID=UPI00030F75EE|nr:hypothetical protein [Nocardia brevicatena]